MIVDSNSNHTLSYVDPTFQTSLFVKSKIWDLSGGSPSLESSVNLVQIDNGVYQGKYQFTAGKPYLVQTLVYTDGTYTTVDQTFAQSVDEIQCVNLNTANLDVAVSTRLATSGYTAPDNADIAAIKAKTDNLPASPADQVTSLAIKAKTDNLPADPASNTEVDTRLASASYTAPNNAGIAAIKSQTDQLAFTSGTVNANTAADPNIALIKAKTDNLPSDPASESVILTAIAGLPHSFTGVKVFTGRVLGANGVPDPDLVSFDLFLGDDLVQPLGVNVNGDPVDLSSVQDIRIQFPNDPSSPAPSPIYEASLVGGQIAVLDAVLGKFNLSIAAADSANFLVQQGYNVDIVVKIANKLTTYRLPNGCNIKKRAP